ncbi:MAG: ribonucleoside-diphosphate reductase subunit alpha [Candidatus Babeliaceae bacterium]|jgi:ribonucleoside-diphosphate reductase alpha chain
MELQNSLRGSNASIPLYDKQQPLFYVIKRDGLTVELSDAKMRTAFMRASSGHEQDINIDLLIKELYKLIFDGITTQELEKAYCMAACTFIEVDPSYDHVATQLLLQRLVREVVGKKYPHAQREKMYRQSFIDAIQCGVKNNYFDQRMATFDLDRLAAHLVPDRDNMFVYTGMFTLYERYLLKHEGRRLEVPQTFWMRIAMGLALLEKDKNERALQFYEVLSTLSYTPSTPTLFHAGFPVAQLSSCYLNVVDDDLSKIFKCMGDNAQLSKWAGGIGTDWTNIRGTGSYIKSIKATSQGVIPYLKIANDIVVAITRSGIRRGGSCAYLETWHIDIEDFLDLRRNTGDDRRRTHDMNTAHWIPDLFMKRVIHDGVWTLFSPHEVPDLHDLYGHAFEARYEFYEREATEGRIKQYRVMSAKQLWRKMLTRLFETGHPWITFKDACNIRSPQDHVGVVHCSNLCTEITLNTSSDETAVCNLGSINLSEHMINGQLDEEKLHRTISTALRMLDNVIDLNFYPIEEAQNSNTRHRPVGLGLMGFQDALFKAKIPFSSQAALDFADSVMEKISYYAIYASSCLAQERGVYSSYYGSKWDRGIFPLDTIDLLERERGLPITVSRLKRLDWDFLKNYVRQHGMRNSNIMAIAPTASISTIVGCYPCIEPIFKNMYVKANVTGEFTNINTYLVKDLKELNLWNQDMLNQIKYHDGDIGAIVGIPDDLKERYKTAFELDAQWLIALTAVKGKWIDQSQSHNVFLKGVSGQKLHDVYMTAWKSGLKTTYYLRTLGATQIEKSTLDAKTFGYTQKRNYDSGTTVAASACSIENTDCESCQ